MPQQQHVCAWVSCQNSETNTRRVRRGAGGTRNREPYHDKGTRTPGRSLNTRNETLHTRHTSACERSAGGTARACVYKYSRMYMLLANIFRTITRDQIP